MRGVKCYELFGGIALKNHAFLNLKKTIICFMDIITDIDTIQVLSYALAYSARLERIRFSRLRSNAFKLC